MKIHYVDKQGVEAILKLLKNKISSIVDAVVFRGTVNSVADLPSLSNADVKPGDMYTVLTESQTTADFVEGAGETIDPYTEVVVVNQGTVLSPEYKWYVLGNVFTTKDKISYGQSLPSMPYDGMLFFYMGPDVTTAGNELYSNSFYAYNEAENTWDYLWTLGDKIWRGTQEEWDALSAAEKDKYEQAEIIGLDNNGVVYVANKVEAGNMNPVTSDAVAKVIASGSGSSTIIPITRIINIGDNLYGWETGNDTPIAKFTFQETGIYLCVFNGILNIQVTDALNGWTITKPAYFGGAPNNNSINFAYVFKCTEPGQELIIKGRAQYTSDRAVVGLAIYGQAIKIGG